jgi:hypothetical protein
MNLLWLKNLIIPQVYAVDDLGGGVEGSSDCLTSASGLNLGGCLEISPGQTIGETFSTPTDLINLVVRNLFVVAGVILFFMLLYSGFLFIQGGTKGKDQARTVMTTAVAGFLLMFSAYWVVQIIKVLTGADIPL